MTIFEGRWLCKSCGSENLGRHESCQPCGSPRPQGTKFYLPENSPVVTDKALLADANSGQDWYCSHCGGANKGAVEGHPLVSCVHCGQARDEADEAHPERLYSANPPSTHSVATLMERQEKRKSDDDRRQARVSGQENVPVNAKGSPLLKWAAMFWGGVLFIALWFMMFYTREVPVELVGRTWDVSVEVQEQKIVDLSGWDLPADAMNVKYKTKIRRHDRVFSHNETRTTTGTRRVYDGTESYSCGMRDMGNGYFQSETCSRSVYRTEFYTDSYQEPVYVDIPVYGTWHIYQAWRWVPARTERATGKDENVAWPAPKLHEKQRIGAKREEYKVSVRVSSDDVRTVSVNKDAWLKADEVPVIKARKNLFGMMRGLVIR